MTLKGTLSMKRPSQNTSRQDEAPDLSEAPWRDRMDKAVLEPPRGIGRNAPLEVTKAIILSKEEYERALKEIEQFFRQEPAPNTPEARRFNELAEQIGRYENRLWRDMPPDSIK